MQSPAVSIQSPRPQGRTQQQPSQQPPSQPQVPFDKQLWTALNVLLNQLGDVERQGLVMFHKIEESFKHPYTQQEAIADTANLLIQLDKMMAQARAEGFGALTLLPASSTIAASTPSASSVTGGTPKPMFLSPRMQSHVYNNSTLLNSNSSNPDPTASTAIALGAGGGDVSMLSPPPFSAATPSAAITGMTPGPTSSIPSPQVLDVNMSTPSAAGMDAIDLSAVSSGGITAPAAVLAQMMEARQKDILTLFNEKNGIKGRAKAVANMMKA
ncbi:hypothetical protein BG006_009515 [Podila minutissima]|uniref:Uncharacterized protein n=1 Tax=Podila minutissima TaxID=64525 RepID=A0A9P5SI57_9FUNG|nr:hypothetical protein BG006_009515 [Podila minutissima]